ncbi:MAG: hypothetical protein AAGJ31_01405 [Verrucomicrobiota bacterium]
MNSGSVLLGFCFLLVSLPAAQSAPRDVADYFLALPEALYEQWDSGPTLDREERESLIARAREGDPKVEGVILLDVRNGYLQVAGSDSGERQTLTMALFRRPDGSALLALTADETFEQREEQGGGEATDFFGFYEVVDGQWKDLTPILAGDWPRKDRYYELPRYGRTIRILDRGRDRLLISKKAGVDFS